VRTRRGALSAEIDPLESSETAIVCEDASAEGQLSSEMGHGARLASHAGMDASNELTQRIIGCAIDVHRALGPCLRERSYEEALALEFEAKDIGFDRQPVVGVSYRNRCVGEYRIDFVVEGAVVVEVKSVSRFDPVFEAQILAYLRASGLHLGLLLNFNSARLADGVKRYIR
jgi:GxxExxY protein